VGLFGSMKAESNGTTTVNGVNHAKVIGKTMGSVEFQVPETFDFLVNIRNKPLNVFDIILAVFLVLQTLVYLSGLMPSWYFVVSFGFWRLSYNIGLGFLLHNQSQNNFIVRRCSYFLEEGSPYREFMKRQLSKKMGSDYDFEKLPIEYNCWLLYRTLVDIILLNDFWTYFLCVFQYTELPDEFGVLDAIRYIFGLVLVVFNWIIKMDALRVVKDFAWYWGDFFFLIDSELTFDGVFQMAPHPMYSIGYIGYYGMSLISRNYTILHVSLAAHLCQFLFLGFVENPHIDKIYKSFTAEEPTLKKQRAILYEGPSAYFRRDLIVFKNFDPFRSADVLTTIILINTCGVYFMNLPTWFYFVQAACWRTFHSIILGFVLQKQSKEKFWTKHYIKYGFSAQDAFSNWKSIYNCSLTMTHVTFFMCALSFYNFPEDNWFSGTWLLRNTLGLILIALHVWTSVEVYEVLGDFGWFYGDFFVTAAHAIPEYTGIYRFLNNPEKVMGHAGQYGLALMSGNWVVFALALFSQCLTFLFLHYVESVHMKKLYGHKVRKESGLSSALSDKIRPFAVVQRVSKFTSEVTGSAENLFTDLKKEVQEPIEQFVDKAKPKITSVVANISETTTKIARPVMLKGMDPSQYSVKCSKREYVLGQPIEIKWAAPEDHSERDWIGVYSVDKKNTLSSKEGLTIISSRGRWSLVGPGTSGVIKFSSDKLPWKPSKYEFRYHHDYGYIILAVSNIIEIKAGEGLENIQVEHGIEIEVLHKQLLEIWKRVLETDDITIEENFFTYAGNEKSAERKAVAFMTFVKNVYGVEFSPKILDSFPTISLLATKLKEAIETLTKVAKPFESEEEEEGKKDK